MKPYHTNYGMTLYHGDVLDVLRELPDESVQCVVTSPPYWALRDYGVSGQLGLEPTPDEYVAKMVSVFAEVRRVLRTDGTCWLNLGDSYNANQGSGFDTNRDGGHRKAAAVSPRLRWGKPKDLVGIPWRVAFALQDDGWWLRSDIIWAKPNPMPESVTDRPTKAHEYLFLLTKSSRYYYDADAIREPHNVDWSDGRRSGQTIGHSVMAGHPLARGGTGQADRSTDYRAFPNPYGRNKRSVWTVATQPYAEAHFATFPAKLIEPCILAGSREGDTVLDPFMGSGTTALVARKHGRQAIGIDINADYLDLTIKRNAQQTLWFTEAAS